jgi:hypothetical protein
MHGPPAAWVCAAARHCLLCMSYFAPAGSSMHARCLCTYRASSRVPLTHAGTGGNPSLGEQAAEESASTITSAVGNADMVQSACCRQPISLLAAQEEHGSLPLDRLLCMSEQMTAPMAATASDAYHAVPACGDERMWAAPQQGSSKPQLPSSCRQGLNARGCHACAGRCSSRPAWAAARARGPPR